MQPVGAFWHTPADDPAEVDAAAANPTTFVTVSGTRLVVAGRPWRLRGATAYGQYGNGTAEAALAHAGRRNALEAVEFATQYHSLSSLTAESTWVRLDGFIAACATAKLRVVLNLSEYGQSLLASGIHPTRHDWGPFLAQVAQRHNTVSGAVYGQDPTIALVQLWGEIPAPASTPAIGTTREMTAFYARSLAQWRSLSPILCASGGFSYLNEYQAGGIDWQTIMADPNNAVCAIEINAFADRDVTVPMVSAFAQAHGKPWFLAAWSSCWAKSSGSWDCNHWPLGDAQMATHAQEMIAVAKGAMIAAMPACGHDLWNLAATPAKLGSCDLGPQYPQTWAVLQAE